MWHQIFQTFQLLSLQSGAYLASVQFMAQMSEPKNISNMLRIPYLPHLSAAKQQYTFAQQNHANYFAKKYSKYCNALMSKV